jgi:hypothetical protein
MQEVQLPIELAFMVRNRLKLRKIPYKEIKIDKIALDQHYIDLIENIISELKEKRGIKTRY